MSDIESDYQATMEMLVPAIGRLHARNPKHVFVEFYKRIGNDNRVYENFKRRFGKPNMSRNVMDITLLFTNFLFEVLIELGEMKRQPLISTKPIVREPSSLDDWPTGEELEASDQQDQCRLALDRHMRTQHQRLLKIARFAIVDRWPIATDDDCDDIPF